jgi:hypothetical protein
MYTVIFDPEVYPIDRAWITGMASARHVEHLETKAPPAISATTDEATENGSSSEKASDKT